MPPQYIKGCIPAYKIVYTNVRGCNNVDKIYIGYEKK